MPVQRKQKTSANIKPEKPLSKKKIICLNNDKRTAELAAEALTKKGAHLKKTGLGNIEPVCN